MFGDWAGRWRDCPIRHAASADPGVPLRGAGNSQAFAMVVDHHGVMSIPPLPETTILMVEVGSTAHGTGIEGVEDHDQLAVVVELPAQLLGLDEDGFKTVMQRTQPEGSRSGPGDIDRTLHSLRRFVRMAAAGNPSILMAMWAPRGVLDAAG